MYTCELRVDGEEEIFIGNIHLPFIPRIGEHICLSTKDNVRKFIVKDVWYFVKQNSTSKFNVVLYVNSIGR